MMAYQPKSLYWERNDFYIHLEYNRTRWVVGFELGYWVEWGLEITCLPLRFSIGYYHDGY